MKDLGRVDYRPKLKKWDVIIYKGLKDILVARVETKEKAEQILQQTIYQLKGNN